MKSKSLLRSIKSKATTYRKPKTRLVAKLRKPRPVARKSRIKY